MSLRLHFDPSFDRGYWPGPLAEREAACGELWVGVAGLLGALETCLGLRGPVVSDNERAAGLLRDVLAQEGFWSQSAEADAFGTVRRLLVLRDELLLAGWAGEALTDRLGRLAAVTQGVRPGSADRLAAVLAALRSRCAEVEEVVLIEPADDLPVLWTQVLDALQRGGTRITRRAIEPAEALGDLQAARSQGFEPTADGSLHMLRPYGELAAADEVAAWLAAHGGRGRTLIIGPDAVLDAALHRYGLATVGALAVEGCTALHALVPLVLAMGWEPADPEQALALLDSPLSPIPPAIARRLRDALVEAPSVRSDSWNARLTEGLAAIADEGRRQAVEARVAAVFKRAALRGSPYPASEIVARLSVLVRWMQRRRYVASETREGIGSASDAAWTSAIGTCETLRDFVRASGFQALSAPQLRTLVYQVLEGAGASSSYSAQVGPASIDDPGAMIGPAETVVWWSFRGEREPRARRLALMPAEHTALAQAGVFVRDPRRVAVCRARRWARPLFQTTRSLLLVAPRGDAESAPPHPLWDEIVARMPNSGMAARVIAERVRTERIARPQRVRLHAPSPQRTFQVPLHRLKKRERWSPSSLETLIGCSLKWVLDRVAGLESPRELPEGNLLLSRIAHGVLAQVFAKFPRSPELAETRADEAFDGYILRYAANLLMPGMDAVHAEVRHVCRQAAHDLACTLRDAKLVPVAMERTYECEALGGTLVGIPDLVLGPSPAVLDFKWSRARYRRKELENGTAHQLAVYSMLVGDGAMIPAGYYVLTQKQLLTTTSSKLGGIPVTARPLDTTWKALVAAFEERWSDAGFGAGIVVADGNPGTDDQSVEESHIDAQGILRLQPPCKFCDHGVLCGAAFRQVT